MLSGFDSLSWNSRDYLAVTLICNCLKKWNTNYVHQVHTTDEVAMRTSYYLEVDWNSWFLVLLLWISVGNRASTFQEEPFTVRLKCAFIPFVPVRFNRDPDN